MYVAGGVHPAQPRPARPFPFRPNAPIERAGLLQPVGNVADTIGSFGVEDAGFVVEKPRVTQYRWGMW